MDYYFFTVAVRVIKLWSQDHEAFSPSLRLIRDNAVNTAFVKAQRTILSRVSIIITEEGTTWMKNVRQL